MKKKTDCIDEHNLRLGDYLRRMFEEIDKNSIQVGEDEHHVYFFNEKKECWSTKSKHWMRLNGEKWKKMSPIQCQVM